MKPASRISNLSAPVPAFHQEMIFATPLTPNSFRLAKILCWFFVQAMLLRDGMAQILNIVNGQSSIVAVVSDRDALAYNNATKLVRGYNGQLHLVFHDQGEIFYTFSRDHGSTWNVPINISNSAGSSVYPTLVVDSLRKHFAWQDDSDATNLSRVDGKKRIWFRSYRINDNSYRFQYRIGEAVGAVLTPSLAVRDERTLIGTWAADMGLGINWEINVSTGSLIGNGLLDQYDWTYPAIPGEALGLGDSFFPSIVTGGNTSYVVWQELNPFGMHLCHFKYQRDDDWSRPQMLRNGIIHLILG
jgi:hypothetical protein